MRGYAKGFIKQTSTIVGIVVALMVAINYYHNFGLYLNNFLDYSEEVLQFVSFAVLFIGVNIVIHMIGFILKKVINLLFLEPIDHISGAVLGLLKGVILAYLLVLILSYIPYEAVTRMLDNSFASRLLDLSPIIQSKLETIFAP